MTGDINTSHYVNWTNQYGLSWTNGGQLTCDMNGDMHLYLNGKIYYFLQTEFTKVTINLIGIGIGCSPTPPLQITTYASSTQTKIFEL